MRNSGRDQLLFSIYFLTNDRHDPYAFNRPTSGVPTHVLERSTVMSKMKGNGEGRLRWGGVEMQGYLLCLDVDAAGRMELQFPVSFASDSSMLEVSVNLCQPLSGSVAVILVYLVGYSMLSVLLNLLTSIGSDFFKTRGRHRMYRNSKYVVGHLGTVVSIATSNRPSMWGGVMPNGGRQDFRDFTLSDSTQGKNGVHSV